VFNGILGKREDGGWRNREVRIGKLMKVDHSFQNDVEAVA
jgi:hypothetical protein